MTESIVVNSGVTNIGSCAFGCRSLTTVYYGGTKSDWERISIGPGNECLTNAKLYNEAHTLTVKYTDWQGEEVFAPVQKSLFYGEGYEIVSPEKTDILRILRLFPEPCPMPM